MHVAEQCNRIWSPKEKPKTPLPAPMNSKKLIEQLVCMVMLSRFDQTQIITLGKKENAILDTNLRL
jgi:hypothetical protein